MNNLQSACFEILKTFADFCEKNDLKYYICGGTLLGAVRHKGFIPWDDDGDVWMPRDDYEQFLALSANGLKKNLSVSHYRNTKHPEKPYSGFTKIMDTNTIIRRIDTANPVDTFICLDIFPLDGMPSSLVARLSRMSILLYYYRTLFSISRINAYTSITVKRNALELLILKLARFLKIDEHINSVKIADQAEKFSSKHKFGNSAFCVSFWGNYRFKEMLQTNFFHEYVWLDFEGVRLRAPAKYELVLRHYYGDDYMIPKREMHHELEA